MRRSQLCEALRQGSSNVRELHCLKLESSGQSMAMPSIFRGIFLESLAPGLVPVPVLVQGQDDQSAPRGRILG